MKYSIESYMSAYWEKYPNEKADDYTADELLELIGGGAILHLTDYILIVYTHKVDSVEILFYCADVGSHDRQTIKHILLQHRSFVEMFSVPIFIGNLNKLFKRDSISRYDVNKNKWRFV